MAAVDIAVAPGVRRIAVPLPLALKIVNVYLVEGASGWALVDTGLHTEDGERALREGINAAGIDLADVCRVFVTHVHPDHIGMVGTMEHVGAEIVMHGPEARHARKLWSGDGELAADSYRWFLHHGMPPDVDESMREAWLAMGRQVDPLGSITELVRGAERDTYSICRGLFPKLRNPHEERFALAETLAHLRYLERRGKIAEIPGEPVRWRMR